jgi:hypothetical protein
MKLYSITILFFFILIGCKPPIDKEGLEEQMKSLQEFGTSEYVLSKIIIAEDNQWYTVGERKVIITMKASVIAGIDFSKIEIKNISNNSISLKLPKAKIILLDIKPDDIEYNFFKVSLTRSAFTNKELNDIQILGEKSITGKIEDLKILDEAGKNANLFLTNWLKNIGFTKINFS